MNIEKIAVIIPNYNMDLTLERTLLSVVSQTYKNLDIYISDNSSTDNSWNIIMKYQAKYKNIKVLKTLSHLAINLHSEFIWSKIDMLDYKYFKTLDADDYLEPTFIEKCYEFHIKSRYRLGYVYTHCNHLKAGENDKIILPSLYKHSAIIRGHEQFKVDIKGYQKVFGQMLFDTELFMKCKNSSFSAASDINMILKLNSISDVGYIKESLFNYTMSDFHESGVNIRNKVMPALIYAAKMDAIRHYFPVNSNESIERHLEYLNFFMVKYCIHLTSKFIENSELKLAMEYLYLAVSFDINFKDSSLFKYFEISILNKEILDSKKINLLKSDYFIYERNMGVAPYNLPKNSIIIE